MQLFLYLNDSLSMSLVTHKTVVYESGYAITNINNTRKKGKICFIWKVKLNMLDLMSPLSATTIHWLLPVAY